MNREMDAVGLLRSAARLVERALIQLDTRETRCKECGQSHYRNFEEMRIYKQFTDLPAKLRGAAVKLGGLPHDVADPEMGEALAPDGQPVGDVGGDGNVAHNAPRGRGR